MIRWFGGWTQSMVNANKQFTSSYSLKYNTCIHILSKGCFFNLGQLLFHRCLPFQMSRKYCLAFRYTFKTLDIVLIKRSNGTLHPPIQKQTRSSPFCGTVQSTETNQCYCWLYLWMFHPDNVISLVEITNDQLCRCWWSYMYHFLLPMESTTSTGYIPQFDLLVQRKMSVTIHPQILNILQNWLCTYKTKFLDPLFIYMDSASLETLQLSSCASMVTVFIGETRAAP